MADDIVYSASLDDDDVLKALKRIDDKLGDLSDSGKKSFKTIEKQSGISATKLGVVSGAVGEITSRLIDLGAQAAQAFLEIGKQGIALNANLERTEQVFTNVFGDPKLGEATVNFLGEVSEKLRISRDEAASFASTILPKSGGLPQFTELLRLTSIQARTTGQSVSELEFSIREALSGDFVSIRDRFDLSRAQIDRIKELTPTLGQAQALITVVGDEFERLGKTDITGTLSDSLAVIQGRFTELNQTLFESPFEELRDAAGRFLDVLDERGPDIEVAAQAISDLLGDITEIVSGAAIDLFENIDFEQVTRIADQFSNLVAGADLFANIVSDANFAQSFLDNVENLLDALNKASTTASQIATLTKAARARDVAEAQFLVGGENASGVAQGVAGALPRFTSFIGGAAVSPGRRAEAEAEGQRAYEAAIRDSLSAFDEYNQKLEENKQQQADRGAAVDDAAQADNEAAINAQLAASALEEQSAAAETAQKQVGEKRGKLEADLQERLLKIQIDGERKRLDDELKNAQRREDIARKNAEKIADIDRKQQERVADLSTDLARDEADLAKKQGQERIRIDRDAAKRREDIERDFRREIEQIQSNFLLNAQDAERNNDAKRFLELQRQNTQQIDAATKNRNQELSDSDQTRQRDIEDVRDSQSQELEAIRQKNQRALEDLQIRLQRELEAQAIANQRQLEEQVISEQRQAEQRALNEQRQLEDYQRLEEQKRAALEASLSEQLELIDNFNSRQVAAAEETANQIGEIYRRFQAGDTAGPQRSPSVGTGGSPFGDLFRGQGGPVSGDQPYIVGEHGPELFVPEQNGGIAPNRAMMSPPLPPGSGGGASQTTVTNSPTFNLSDSMFSDPVARQQLRNFVLGVFAEAS